jgi:hypothetical protein
MDDPRFADLADEAATALAGAVEKVAAATG